MGRGDVFPDHVGGEHDNVYALVETLCSCQVAGPLWKGRRERVCEEDRGRWCEG